MQDTDLPEKIEPTSLNLQTELAKQLAELVPEAMSDGKLDVTKLRELVNGDAENSPEKFGLFWPGKRAAQALAQIPTTATLIPAPEESVDWDNTKNIFIEGDNLEVLKALQNSYRRKVKMIYIDPPYNTGKEFIYPDKFSEGLQGYLEYTGQKNEAGENTESKPETGGRRHSNWLSMMYPRLQLAKSLLRNDGIIFISIGENEQANLTEISNDVFGEENHVTTYIWHNNVKGRQMDLNIKNTHEFILVYARDISSLEVNNEMESVDTTSMLSDEVSHYKKGYPLHNGTADFHINNRPNLAYSIYYNPFTGDATTLDEKIGEPGVFSIGQPGQKGKGYLDEGYVRIIPKYNMTYNNQRVWRWGAEKFSKEYHSELIFVKEEGGYYVYGKDRIVNGYAEKKPKNYINIDGGSGKKDIVSIMEPRVFENPKPIRLLSELLKVGSDQDSIVLDFFSGSGTTAHAVMQLNAQDSGNRKHIQVQLPEPTDAKSEAFKAGYKNIADISKERIRRAGKKIREDYTDKIAKRITPLDTGFRVYKLAPSNFVQWDENKAKDDIQQSVLDFAANKKPDAAPEALLTEITLQARMPLSANIEKRDLQSGGWVYVVDGGNLVAYVANEQITEAQANEIADLAPAKLIVLDSAFNGNNALKINVANICKEKFIKEFKTI